MNSYIDFRAVAEECLVAHANSNLYFLLDHAGLPGLHARLAGSSAKWVSLFEGTKECNALQVAPILVFVGNREGIRISRSLLTWLGENGTYSSAVIMISSVLPIESLAKRLAARLHVRLTNSMDAMFRFYDPRVMESLLGILSVKSASAFFSPAEKWWYVNRAGHLIGFRSKFNIAEEFELPLELSAKEEFGLLEASEQDQVIASLRDLAPNLLINVALPAQHEFVSRKIEDAKRWGLISLTDLVLYIGVILSRGEDYVTSPAWMGLLGDMRSRKADFAQAVAALEN